MYNWKMISLIIAGVIMFTLQSSIAGFPENPDDMGGLVKRENIDPKYKWNLEDIYKTPAGWDKDYEWLKNNIKNFKKFEGKLGSSDKVLLECLQLQDELGMKLGKCHLYASLAKDLDFGNSENMARYEKIMAVVNDLGTYTSFITPEILSIPDSKIKSFMENNKALQLYKHALNDVLRVKPHTLPKEQEELMSYSAAVASIYENTYKIFANADIKFPTIKDENGKEIELSHGRYYSAMSSLDRDYRKRAYKEYYVPYLDHKNTLTSLYVGSIKDKIFRSKARKYPTTIEAALNRNNIPVDVYKNLVNTVNKNLEPLHKWGELKKKVLKLDELHPYDVYVTLFPTVKKKYTYDEAVDICLEALKPLGEEYINDLKFAFSNRWIDVYETKGKRSGAYSSGTVKGVHPYVLLNWTGELNDVFTLAHEMGHNMHSWYTQNNQPAVYADYPIFLAEVASITNETLLMDYLIKNAKTKEEKLSLIETYLNNIKGTFYRQTRFAEFEMKVQDLMENGEVMTVDKLNKIFGDDFKKYWGPAMVVDEEETFSWARIRHFYYNFYVFQYATGLAAAEALAADIINEGQPAVDRYLEFLKSGKSDYAINILKKAGVDMTSPKPILAVVNKMKGLLNEMETLLK